MTHIASLHSARRACCGTSSALFGIRMLLETYGQATQADPRTVQPSPFQALNRLLQCAFSDHLTKLPIADVEAIFALSLWTIHSEELGTLRVESEAGHCSL